MNLFIDIETIPDQRPDAFERYVSEVNAPGQYKKQESIDKWLLENAETVALESYKKTSLNGLHGEIASIAFAIDDRDIRVLTRFLDDKIKREANLLEFFWEAVRDEINANGEDVTGNAKFSKPRWIGHNVLDFDLRFMKQRSLVCNVVPLYEIPADAKHGWDSAFDTMKEWGGWRGYVKQAELVEAFGIPAPDWVSADAAEIDGSQVFELFREGRFDLISEYNRLDVHYVREIYRRMAFA